MQGPPGDPRYGQNAYAPTAFAPPPHQQANAQYGGYGGPQAQGGYNAAPSPTPHAPQPAQQGWAGHVPSFGGLPNVGLPRGFGASVPQPSGLPAPVAFGLGIVAVLVALVFDVIFLKVHVPGIGAYAWYLTTALSFAGAGYGSAKWTKATRTVAMTAVGIAGVLYGIADLGLGLVVEDLSMGGAIMLGAQGVAIAFVTGFGGVYRGLRAKDD